MGSGDSAPRLPEEANRQTARCQKGPAPRSCERGQRKAATSAGPARPEPGEGGGVRQLMLSDSGALENALPAARLPGRRGSG